MPIIDSEIHAQFTAYSGGHRVSPLLIHGDALSILQHLPDDAIDCCMTSPPYWGKRQYLNGGIGNEPD